MEPFRVPWWAWPPSLLGGVAAALLAVEMPGDFAYWASVPLGVPLMLCVTGRLMPWQEVPRGRRVAATAGAIALAVPIWPLLILAPGDRSWLIASLLVLPLGAVLLARFADDDDEDVAGARVFDGPAGPPGT